jgi:hypothetical protein
MFFSFSDNLLEIMKTTNAQQTADSPDRGLSDNHAYFLE